MTNDIAIITLGLMKDIILDEEKPNLVLALDCGINAIAEVQALKNENEKLRRLITDEYDGFRDLGNDISVVACNHCRNSDGGECRLSEELPCELSAEQSLDLFLRYGSEDD